MPSSGQQLRTACISGDVAAVRKLLDEGAHVDWKNENGWTALISASSQGHDEVVNLLLDRGALLDIQMDDGWTALMYASLFERVDCVRLLLERGADMSLKSMSGMTSKDKAVKKGHVNIVQLLDEATKEKCDLVHININLVQTAGHNQALERREATTQTTETTTTASFDDKLNQMHDLVNEFKIIVASLQPKEHANNTANIREVNNIRPKSLCKRASWRIVVLLLLVTALLVLFGWKCRRDEGLLFHTTPGGDYNESLWVGKQTVRRAQDTQMDLLEAPINEEYSHNEQALAIKKELSSTLDHTEIVEQYDECLEEMAIHEKGAAMDMCEEDLEKVEQCDQECGYFS